MNEEGIANEEIELRILNEANQKYQSKINQYGIDMMKIAEKRIMLSQIDTDTLRYLRQVADG